MSCHATALNGQFWQIAGRGVSRLPFQEIMKKPGWNARFLKGRAVLIRDSRVF